MHERAPRIILGILITLLVWLAHPALVQRAVADTNAPLARAAALRDQAAADCADSQDVLRRVLCRGKLRVGLRADYRGFSVRDADGTLVGFEVDLANAIAAFLGVAMEPVIVDPKSRIPILAGRGADLVIATMGHTLQRDPNAGFVRPHYFGSRTVVVGPADSTVHDWDDLRGGHAVCLPLGASFNILFVQRHIRILTFDNATALMDALSFGQCQFIAHDDTFFARYVADPAWSSRFAIRFGFAPLPWGMAVPPEDGTHLQSLLSALSLAWLRDGTLLSLAERHQLPTQFLADQRARLSAPGCVMADGSPEPACLFPPVDTSIGDRESVLAPAAAALEAALSAWFGLTVDLTVVKKEASASLVLEGIGYSLAMVAGSMVTTLGFAFLLAALAASRFAPARWLGALLIQIGQSTPMPLLLFFGYIVAGGLTTYSPMVALLTAMVMLGFYNGGYTASALHDAALTLGQVPGGRMPTQRTIVALAWTQIVAFLINATKGAPAADMIGVPEFLGVITDLTAHTRDRFVLYTILLVFYTALVLLAIWGMTLIERRVVARWGRP